ncbi:MAG: M55 family metallopeptidase, partial [Chloroflexi bacterium]|nr:M55 family metallopeptidase [Chloroflexota bacterium]
MKILISCDMEGISGVVDWEHVTPGTAEWSRFRELMTGDVNAAVAGCHQAGAERVLVSDAHSNGRNLPRERLDPRAWLNSGSPSPFSMMQGIDSGVDGVCFVGYHARAGTLNGVLCHTWSDGVRDVWLNGAPVGEIGLNASLAGHFGASVLMLSGDQMAALEVQEFVGAGVQVAVVKQGRGRFAAELAPPEQARDLIHAAAAAGVKRLAEGNAPAPARIEGQVRLGLDFMYPHQADKAALAPGAERLSGTRLQFVAADMPAAYRAMRA